MTALEPSTVPDGTETMDDVEVPYIVTTVTCRTPGCVDEGVPFEIKLFVNSVGASCAHCANADTMAGRKPHRHRVKDADWKRMKGLQEPEKWVKKRERANALQELLDAAEAGEVVLKGKAADRAAARAAKAAVKATTT